MTMTLVIVGRPNVGKSTLFNRLVGQKRALVNPQPGMTRDWKEAPISLCGTPFTLIDTPGIRDFKDDPLSQDMERQTDHGIEQGDVILFMLDIAQGLTTVDLEIAQWLRQKNKPIIVLLNKSEGRRGEIAPFYPLGFPEMVAISAQEGLGLDELFYALTPFLDAAEKGFLALDKPLFQLAIVGRPNAGKSTLINKILKQERLITSATAGSTRDSIALPVHFRGKLLQIIDTAGIRRASSVAKESEQQAVDDAKRAIQYAQVVGMVVDATAPLEQQDLTILRHIIQEGRAFFLIVNKIDLVPDIDALKKSIQYILEKSLAQVKRIQVIYMSALEGVDFDAVFQMAQQLYELWNTRLTTGQLNRWLELTLENHSPPMHNGKRIKIRYMTQVKTRPPTFALFASKTDELPQSYMNYLENQMRQDFNLYGIPLRLMLRKNKNPYVDAPR